MRGRRSAAVGAIVGAAMAAFGSAAIRVYKARSLERQESAEALETAEVSASFANIASMPQMRLLRQIAIGRALALSGLAGDNGQAVDLGCGPGHLAVELAAQAPGLRVTGLDLSTPLLADAYRRASGAGLAHRVEFRTADARATPFEAGSADLVVSTLSLHHWSDPVAVLDEVARITRPGGAFLIFDLRRDMIPPLYLLVWFAARFVVPQPLRQIGEPLRSRNASYEPDEAAALAQASRLTGWRVARGPFWLSIEGITSA